MALAEPLRWLVASTAVLVLLGTSTIQSTSWREEENLWVDPDEDPACMTDPSFLATNAHLLHYWSQSDRRAALEALDRAVRSKDPTESGLSCAVRARGLIEAVQFARFDLADRWASPLAESCPHEAETWNALMALSIHRRPPAAAAAAQRAWRLSPTPRTAALLAITAAEAGDPDARQWALRAVEAAPQEACPPLVQWVSEVSLQQSEVLVEAFFACGAFTPMCQEGFGIP